MRWEGMRSAVYLDVRGLPTIGVGHLLTHDELTSGKIYIRNQYVRYYHGLTKDQVLTLFRQDLMAYEYVVSDAVIVPLKVHEFDVLCSFSFNVGLEAFKRSTLLRVLNQGEYANVPHQIRRWIYAGGEKIDGLVMRRRREADIWEKGYG